MAKINAQEVPAIVGERPSTHKINTRVAEIVDVPVTKLSTTRAYDGATAFEQIDPDTVDEEEIQRLERELMDPDPEKDLDTEEAREQVRRIKNQHRKSERVNRATERRLAMQREWKSRAEDATNSLASGIAEGAVAFPFIMGLGEIAAKGLTGTQALAGSIFSTAGWLFGGFFVGRVVRALDIMIGKSNFGSIISPIANWLVYGYAAAFSAKIALLALTGGLTFGIGTVVLPLAGYALTSAGYYLGRKTEPSEIAKKARNAFFGTSPIWASKLVDARGWPTLKKMLGEFHG